MRTGGVKSPRCSSRILKVPLRSGDAAEICDAATIHARTSPDSANGDDLRWYPSARRGHGGIPRRAEGAHAAAWANRFCDAISQWRLLPANAATACRRSPAAAASARAGGGGAQRSRLRHHAHRRGGTLRVRAIHGNRRARRVLDDAAAPVGLQVAHCWHSAVSPPLLSRRAEAQHDRRRVAEPRGPASAPDRQVTHPPVMIRTSTRRFGSRHSCSAARSRMPSHDCTCSVSPRYS